MPRILTAKDKTSIVRLASFLPQGSPERRAILAGLQALGFSNPKMGSLDPIGSWVQKHRREIEGLPEDLFQVTRKGDGWLILLDAGKKYFSSITTWNPEYNVFDHSRDWARGMPWDEASWDVNDPKDFLKHLDRLLKIALKSVGSTEVALQKDPEGGFKVFVGPKKIGEIWKGLDKKWHNSNQGVGRGFRFNSKEDALADLLEGSKNSASRGTPNPVFE